MGEMKMSDKWALDKTKCAICKCVRWKHGMSRRRFVPVCTGCLEKGAAGSEHTFQPSEVKQ